MAPRRVSGERTLLRLVAVLAVLLVLGPVAPARADPPGLVWSVAVNGQDLRSASAADPLRLGASDTARVELTLDNRGPEELQIRSVRIEGRVIGMAFFSYTTRLDIVLPAGQQTARRFDIDISDLPVQATGLIPGTVTLIGPDRRAVADAGFATEVEGSLFSVYGLFGLIMAGITALVLAGLLIAVWRGSLPRNRWQRGVRFLPAGVGIGLVVTFTLSATGLLVPSAVWWLPLLLLCAGGAFVIGYLLPLGHDRMPGGNHSEATVLRPTRSP